MYRKQVRRRRTVLVLLVVACLVLISTHFSEGETGPLHRFENGVGTVLGPIGDGASRALKPVRDLVGWVDETFSARGDNNKLQSEVDDLRTQLVDTQQKLDDGTKAGKIGKVTDEPELSSYTPVQARVSLRSPSTWDQTLAIDKGSSDGVKVNDAVIAAGGLVGRVSSTGGGTSRVKLISDQESSVTARVAAAKGPTGLITASVGDPRDLIFELIQGDKEVRSGSKLITAGIDDPTLPSRFPGGIPIGEAKKSSASDQELRQQVHITPYVDLSDLSLVSVLTGGSGK